MNRKQVIAAAVFALVGSSAAFAQSSEADLQHFGAGQVSTVSRAAVRAEVLSAQAAGELAVPSEVVAAALPARQAGVATAGVSRARVKADLAGADLTTPADVTASAIPARSALRRDVVRAEARAQARADTYQSNARIGAGF